MRTFRRRRVYSILGFLGVVAFIFFCFQVFSLNVLNDENAREARISRMDHVHDEVGKVAPPTTKKTSQLDSRLAGRSTLAPLEINQHIEEDCMPGSDCAKRAKEKLDSEHGGEKRRQKYANIRVPTDNPAKDVSADIKTPGSLHDSNKRLQDRIEKFGQYVDEKIKQNEEYEKVYKEKLEKHRKQNITGNKQENGSSVLGVLQQDQHLYQPNEKKMFTCLHSKEQIPWSQVNDDFCDCTDGTDEPGTSACPQSKFYCTFQLEENKALWVPSSQVHDGICDCCDGSDESANVTLPPQLKRDREHGGVYHAPCTNRCGKLIEMKLEKIHTRQQGLLMRQQLVENVNSNYANLDKKMYGEDGAWYYLYQHCFETKADKYTYTVCPFKSVVQQSGPGSSTNIGRDPTWVSFNSADGYMLKMSEGDSIQCPERRARTAMVEFTCGIENKILGVHESESCVYAIEFATPLACL